MKKQYYALLLLCFLHATASFAQQKNDSVQVLTTKIVEPMLEEEEYPSLIVAETPPRFLSPSDYKTEFEKWINQKIVYPVIAMENGIQGRVAIEFTIDTDGSVTNVRVLKGVDPSLDKEAMRVIKSSPKWYPAKQYGQAVPYPIQINVSYRLLN